MKRRAALASSLQPRTLIEKRAHTPPMVGPRAVYGARLGRRKRRAAKIGHEQAAKPRGQVNDGVIGLLCTLNCNNDRITAFKWQGIPIRAINLVAWLKSGQQDEHHKTPVCFCPAR
jgi:hypothetical protein